MLRAQPPRGLSYKDSPSAGVGPCGEAGLLSLPREEDTKEVQWPVLLFQTDPREDKRTGLHKAQERVTVPQLPKVSTMQLASLT